jgi:hypothetical protein
VYPHAKNALSVIIGPMPDPGTTTIAEAIKAFQKKYPLFARKFLYENVSWPCYENKKLLVAAFKFKHPEYRIRLSPNQAFFNRKKAVWSSDGFFRDLNSPLAQQTQPNNSAQ